MKIVKRIGIALILSLFLMGILPFFAAPLINDMALKQYQSELLRELELPESMEFVEAVSGCGNSSGTGNHTDLYVAVLVKTSLREEEVMEIFPFAKSIARDGSSTFAMELLGIGFSKAGEKGYYILEFEEEAPYSELDLRGH